MREIINIQNLCYTYLPDTPYKKKALENISFSLWEGDCLGIIGANGSGKTTLIQHLNGILYPTHGQVQIHGIDTSSDELRNNLWQKVGLVFQYPEQQIFEATVFDDVAYGPKNQGLKDDEVRARVEKALSQVGLDAKEVMPLSTAILSGGIRRRVAIAGVLAIEPQILILDEPTAGLDPKGRKTILQVIKKLQKEASTTVIIVSHSLKDVMSVTNKIALLDKGQLIFFGPTKDILRREIFRNERKFMLPDYLKVAYQLIKQGIDIKADLTNMIEFEKELYRLMKEDPNE